ncbi:MAG: HPr(Ser) kinase/phosphatase [Gemmatimonadota bacterium]|jgi:HPr kinase/phosphorylase
MASPPVAPSRLTVRELLEVKKESLQLELMTPGVPLDLPLEDEDISSPGLALSGYTGRVPEGRLQVFGETEITYLTTLSRETREARLRGLFAFRVPALFVTKGQEVPEPLVAVATESGIPVFRSTLSTKDFYRRIKPYLRRALAPVTNLHGSLADVYGVGLLFVGRSGVGKSECVLDLVERGHRLVADDVVRARRMGNDILIGEGLAMQRHHMEIRGIGIIDIGALFGIRAIRQQKRIEVVVQLEHWDDTRQYNRTGLETESQEILGVRVPRVTVPLNPGKNITVISEVVAMNHLLRYAGVDTAQAFNDRLKASMQPVLEYLEEDYE